MQNPDVLVIGGGIAGCAAALAAAEAGARVRIVRRAPAATALCHGGWLGTPPPQIRAALAAAGYELLQPDGPLPHADGRRLHADWTTAAHAAAHSAAGDTVVCGIAGVSWFRPAALGRLWADNGAPLRDVTLTLPGTPAAGWATASLAARIEAEPELLLHALHQTRDDIAGGHLVFPPVLGMHHHTRVMQTLADTGIRIGESLGGSPSLPGWRLDAALQRVLHNAGIEQLQRSARVNAGSGGYDVVMDGFTLRPGAIVLATGKFIGGGIETAPGFVEPAASLTVTAHAAGRDFSSATESLPLTNLDRRAEQALLAAGVTEAPPGIFPAGAVRAGIETAALGLGDAASDGWRAGTAAAAFAAGSEAWR